MDCSMSGLLKSVLFVAVGASFFGIFELNL